MVRACAGLDVARRSALQKSPVNYFLLTCKEFDGAATGMPPTRVGQALWMNARLNIRYANISLRRNLVLLFHNKTRLSLCINSDSST
jgi:hypothetical protein